MFTSFRSFWSGSSTPASSSSPLQELTSENLDQLEQFSKSHPNAKIAVIGAGKIVLDNQPVSFWAYFPGTASYKAKKESYQQGILKARELLRSKFDDVAVGRFDRHFAYRHRVGSPLDVKAFCTFVCRENELRENTFKLSSSVSGKPHTLETLRGELRDESKSSGRIIGSKQTRNKPAPAYSFEEAIIWSECSSKADTEAVRKGNQEGIVEVRKAISGALEGHCEPQGTMKIMLHFDQNFLGIPKEGEVVSSVEHASLTVKDVSEFVSTAIKERDYYNHLLGEMENFIEEVSQGASDAVADKEAQAAYVAQKVESFVHSKVKDVEKLYNILGDVAAAAIILEEGKNTQDPITLALKTLLGAAVVTRQSTTERLLTAIMMHYIGTPDQQPVVKSWFTNAFTKLEHIAVFL